MPEYVHSRDSRRKREKGAKNIFEDIIAENFSPLENEVDIPLQEVQRVPHGSQRGTYEDTLSLKWQNLKVKKYEKQQGESNK